MRRAEGYITLEAAVVMPLCMLATAILLYTGIYLHDYAGMASTVRTSAEAYSQNPQEREADPKELERGVGAAMFLKEGETRAVVEEARGLDFWNRGRTFRVTREYDLPFNRWVMGMRQKPGLLQVENPVGNHNMLRFAEQMELAAEMLKKME
ncbi:pilus assembly protein [Anaerotalea alkaliphila]|uniref:Pilus assembly protein n=1 Tax=Anaerotalea alkaliphila TaxID=2662126 RepID=A0A7X5HXI6_9FIRM|nr:pilus assembly protein [Anaerotalea alkaliphila]NDL68438.1 hypothetical protein [Anaerotalea alkaliphila]